VVARLAGGAWAPLASRTEASVTSMALWKAMAAIMKSLPSSSHIHDGKPVVAGHLASIKSLLQLRAAHTRVLLGWRKALEPIRQHVVQSLGRGTCGDRRAAACFQAALQNFWKVDAQPEK
jgi:hypothetical protein